MRRSHRPVADGECKSGHSLVASISRQRGFAAEVRIGVDRQLSVLFTQLADHGERFGAFAGYALDAMELARFALKIGGRRSTPAGFRRPWVKRFRAEGAAGWFAGCNEGA